MKEQVRGTQGSFSFLLFTSHWKAFGSKERYHITEGSKGFMRDV